MAPRVSVVLAVRDGERYLESSVRSILGQCLRDLELIVVDDGSADRTPEILQRLQRTENRLVVLRQKRQGQAAALNQGLLAARGEYIARQDADDISHPERLERQVVFLDAHPTVGVVGSWADVIDESGMVVGRLTAPVGARYVRRHLLTLRSTPVHGSILARKEAIASAGGYREAFRLAQDFDLWLRLSERFDIRNLEEVLYQWRMARHSLRGHRREVQLKYAGIALVFAGERRLGAGDSYDLLERSNGELDRFADRYRLGGAVHAIWGELLLRGLGNSRQVRRHLRRALLRGHTSLWTLCLLCWAHLVLPWPGGRPLEPAGPSLETPVGAVERER